MADKNPNLGEQFEAVGIPTREYHPAGGSVPVDSTLFPRKIAGRRDVFRERVLKLPHMTRDFHVPDIGNEVVESLLDHRYTQDAHYPSDN